MAGDTRRALDSESQRIIATDRSIESVACRTPAPPAVAGRMTHPYTRHIPLQPLRPLSRRIAIGLVATCAAAVVTAGCGRSTPADPGVLLADAKRTLDTAPAVHFQLSSTRAQGGGVLLVGGQGDAKRPAEFSGKLDVSFDGLPVSLSVVSVNHTFWVKPPFSTKFETADPTKYAFNDPALLLDPERGLSSALARAKAPALGDPDRYQGEQLEEVRANLPGDLVASLLTSADTSVPRKDVPAVFGINPETRQLRRVALTGLFFDPKKTSSYTLVLDRYGEDVTITRPD